MGNNKDKGGSGGGRGRGKGGRRKGGKGGGKGGGTGGGKGAGAKGAGGPGGAGGAPAPPQRKLKPQVRLFYLKSHLVLRIFNYLDETSRRNSFCVMGWKLDGYLKRRANLRAGLVRQRRQQLMHAEKLRRETQAKEEPNPPKKEEGENKSVGDVKGSAVAEPQQEEEEKKSPAEGETNPEDEGQQSVPVQEMQGLAIKDEDMIFKEADLLPLLSARLDPDTLLDRLNTRRLYLRVLHFKRKERQRRADEASQGEGQVARTSAQRARDKLAAERVYRKNIDIQDMADLEWQELIDMAELRNHGKEELYEPMPTQHELLLFSPCPRAVAVLASYPRSGNSLMRTMYEHTTLRVTGSDMQGGLAKHDLVGEMAMGENMVQFVKTHFPERQGAAPFRGSMVVLLVRNPFDAMESYFNLMMTGTHTATVTDEVRKRTTKVFEAYVLREIRVWLGFHTFWMSQDIPLLLVRYEDLIRAPDKVVARVIAFVLEIQFMGTFFTQRIDRCIREQAEIERLGSYKPRSGGIGKSLSKYSPALVKKLKSNEQLIQTMSTFGYTDMLHKPVEEWANMTPLKNYATEYLPTWHNTDEKKVVQLNKGNLARTTAEQTNWMAIKNSLGIFEKDCDCAKCEALKLKAKQAKASGADDEGVGEPGKKSAKGEDKVEGDQGVVGESNTKEATSSGADEGVGEPGKKSAKGEDKVEAEQGVVGESSTDDQGEADGTPAPGASENNTNEQVDSGAGQGENKTSG